jgi:hypothetical protein
LAHGASGLHRRASFYILKEKYMPFTQEDIEKLFTYREWTDAEVAKFKPLRIMAMAYAQAIVDNVPSCPEQTLAIRAIHQASMLVNVAATLHPEDTHDAG